jgi:outer membrane lipopolysaccharide assembly protein LptE/RlpB
MRRAAARSRSVALCASALVLAACGFRLQGHEGLPHTLASVRIEAVDTQSQFYQSLRDALHAAGARIDDDAQDAGATVIHILRDDVKQDVLAVSTRNVPTAYELTYSVRFSVSNGSHELIRPEEHSLLRDYAFEETTLLAKERERTILSNALAQDLATVVMRRLASL